MVGMLLSSIGLACQFVVHAANGGRMPAAIEIIDEYRSLGYVKMDYEGTDRTHLNWLGDWITNGKYLVSSADILIDIGLYASAVQFFFF